MNEQELLAKASLPEILDSVWSTLAAGAERATRPFHTGAIATLGADGPSVRTVVLRRVDRATNQLICHTDRRSPKFTELAQDNRIAWHFYAAELKVQIRVRGRASLHVDDELADRQWAASHPNSRVCYRAAVAPGVAVDHPGGVPVAGDGRGNFAVVACRAHDIDWLLLRHQGHRRARFEWQRGAWQGAWAGP